MQHMGCFQTLKSYRLPKCYPEFNARTAHMVPGTPTPVSMVVDTANRSFTFTMKSPPTSWLLMQAAGVNKGSGSPPAGKGLIQLGNAPNPALPESASVPTIGFKEIGTVSLKHIYEIARIKQGDEHLKHVPLRDLAKSVLGTARNVGIRVVRESMSFIDEKSKPRPSSLLRDSIC